ncbi:hypothetical protein VT84_21895 [Gemmata sp. SH-PL17]|uniref:hypothetical protein n=1 Tax=Gemmata sp. SH-PL17 TaxID=1630693 RepID=UPI0004B45FED|nr:hypothetical protein [Gemmata sp. SH-PL17]AMV27070.1 hypothetical protein VT84_21895 [Gemmata sp. SH-PL17]
MTNDAKFGMLVGVLGVVGASVFLAKPPVQSGAPETQSQQQISIQTALPANTPVANTTPVVHPQPEPGLAALPSTPVVRTRKDVEAKPTSRQSGADEEP